LPERGRQLHQPLDRRLRPEVIVAIDDLDAFPGLDLDRHDLFHQAPLTPRGVGELLAAARVAVLRLTRDAVLRRTGLCCELHRTAAVRVDERLPQRIFQLALTEPETAAESTNNMRRLAHALDPAREHQARFLELDHLRAADRSLDAGAAQAIDRERRHLNRYARPQCDVAGTVDRVGARLGHVAEHGMGDPPGLFARAPRRPPPGDRTELDCRDVLERADIVGHRRARAADDEDVRFVHGRELTLSKRWSLPFGIGVRRFGCRGLLASRYGFPAR